VKRLSSRDFGSGLNEWAAKNLFTNSGIVLLNYSRPGEIQRRRMTWGYGQTSKAFRAPPHTSVLRNRNPPAKIVTASKRKAFVAIET